MNKSKFIEYLKKNKLDVQGANVRLGLFYSTIKYYYNSKIIPGFDIGKMSGYVSYKGDSSYMMIEEEKMKLLSKRLYDLFSKNIDKLISIIEKHKIQFNNLEKHYMNMPEKITLDFYNKFNLLSDKWWQIALIGEEKGRVIENFIIPNFKKRHSLTKNEAIKIISTMSHPDKQAIFNKERIDYYRICLEIISHELATDLKNRDYIKILENRKIKLRIDKYLKNYFWIKTNFYKFKKINEIVLLDEIKKEIKKNSKIQINKSLNELITSFKKIKKEKNTIKKKINLKKIDLQEILFSKSIISWGDVRKHCMMKYVYYSFDILEKIGKLNKISFEDISKYRKSEICNLLECNKKISKKELKRREEVFILLGKKEGLFYGKTAKEMIAQVHKANLSELKGLIASTGNYDFIDGKVKIIYNPEESKIKKDEIMVTTMTRVEYVPLMKKAKAIITDEGGLACHAAIVSRELEVPCIIGTKSATKILNNGDLIRLNLKTGKIEFINKIVENKKIKTKKKKIVTANAKSNNKNRVLWLDKIRKTDLPILGRKAFNLANLRKEYNVPNAFCLTTNFYEEYKKKGLTKELKNIVLTELKKLKDKKFAVRSSALAEDLEGASFAGQHDSFLNTEKDEIFKKIKLCFDSINTKRAKEYRKIKSIKKTSICVIIQEMINPDYAGVMFTLDPINKRSILIETTKGLGESLVSGLITPKTYFINNKCNRITKTYNTKSKEKEILEISKIGKKIEELFKNPQDIEFAVKNKKIWILQSRDITTL